MPFNDEKNLVIGRDNYIFFYDISDYYKPVLLSTSNLDDDNTSLDSGYVTSDNKFIVLSADT